MCLALADVASASSRSLDPHAAAPVQEARTTDGGSAVAQKDEARRLDSLKIAQQTRRPVADVLGDLLWQDKVTAEMQRLDRQHGASLVGSRILSHEERRLWVGFTSAAPRTEFPAGTAATVVSNRPLSRTDLQNNAVRLAREAEKSFGAQATAVPDIMTNTITLAVAKDRPTDAGTALTQATQAASRALGQPIGAAVKVVFDPKSAVDLEGLGGGGKLEVAGTESLLCTSAFTIAKNGATGLLTAQHCNRSFTHENYSGATEYSASTVMSTLGGNGDLRWYNTRNEELPRFRANYSDIRTLYAAPGMQEGQWLCHFGYGNGKSCDTIYRIGVSSSGVGNQIAMEHHYTTGGNSGGPWYFGSDGFGVHRGAVLLNGSSRAIFTPLNRVFPAFGAYILVSPS